MNIRMLGIDHDHATVEFRELFAFTKKSAVSFMQKITQEEGILGCIVISTCNRSEVWISCNEKYEGNLYTYICQEKQVPTIAYEEYFIERAGYEAVKHLFYLTTGLKSKIICEDQILTQVKDALALSRESYCTDNVLEVLFRMSITSAKKVKTEIHLKTADESIIHRVINYLKEQDIRLKDKNCLIIGNGEMGKLSATKLLEEGAKVTVTVREYRRGLVEIPEGANPISYSERLNDFNQYDIIVSATASPNVTLKVDYFKDIPFTKNKLFIDLAVPRDIDPEIAQLPNAQLFNIDSFQINLISENTKQQIHDIEGQLDEQVNEFIKWYKCKDIIPVIMEVSENAANDLILRLDKKVKSLRVDEQEKKLLDESIKLAASKVVNKLMFSIRDHVKAETFRECMEAIQKTY